MDLGAVIIALFVGLVVKVMVMVLGARIVLKLYQATYPNPPKKLWLLLPDEHLPEIRILWWSLVFFFVGEFTCGIEVYILLRSSAILAAIHSFVSSAGMGLFGLGMYLYLDKKMIRYGEPRCLANRMCLGCTFHEKEGCKFRVVALLVATFVAMVAVPPFFAPTERMAADTRKYILPFESLNNWYDQSVVPWLKAHVSSYQPTGEAYFLPASMFVIEFRVLPAIALAVSLVGIVLLRTRQELLGLRWVVFVVGMLCYTYLQIMLYPVMGDVLLGGLGHELVELWFLVISAEFLRRAFSQKRELAQVTVS